MPHGQRIAQTDVTGAPHHHIAAFAALLGDRCDARLSAQGRIVSLGEGLSALGQHRGGDEISDPWDGAKDLGVTMLFFLPRCILPTGRASRSTLPGFKSPPGCSRREGEEGTPGKAAMV